MPAPVFSWGRHGDLRIGMWVRLLCVRMKTETTHGVASDDLVSVNVIISFSSRRERRRWRQVFVLLRTC